MARRLRRRMPAVSLSVSALTFVVSRNAAGEDLTPVRLGGGCLEKSQPDGVDSHARQSVAR